MDFRVTNKTTKISFVTNTKDLNTFSKEILCSVLIQLSRLYIGKTERTLFERTLEHSRNKDSAVFCQSHLNNCPNFQHIKSLFNPPSHPSSEQQQSNSNTYNFFSKNIRNRTSMCPPSSTLSLTGICYYYSKRHCTSK